MRLGLMYIDVVYTWVNHEDKKWQKLYRSALFDASSMRGLHDTVADIARFQSRNELKYSIRSVRRYAPWVRNIFVVTNCELPREMVDNQGIIPISHESIFKSPDILPVFNSHAIEANLHRIPGLSEQFLYFNDDFFLSAPLAELDFFTENGSPYVFLSKHEIPYDMSDGLRPVDYAAINTGKLLEADFGYRPARKLHHAPYPLLRSTLFEIEDRYEGPLSATSSHKFRENSDLPLATTLHAYYSLHLEYGRLGYIKCRYVDVGDPLFIFLIHPLSPLYKGRYQTFCLNEVKSMPYFSEVRDKVVGKFLEHMFYE